METTSPGEPTTKDSSEGLTRVYKEGRKWGWSWYPGDQDCKGEWGTEDWHSEYTNGNNFRVGPSPGWKFLERKNGSLGNRQGPREGSGKGYTGFQGRKTEWLAILGREERTRAEPLQQGGENGAVQPTIYTIKAYKKQHNTDTIISSFCSPSLCDTIKTVSQSSVMMC